MTPPPPPSTSQNGIDIRDALSILSDRSKKGGDNDLTQSSVPDELKEMGQTIDVAGQMEFTKPNAVGCDCARDYDDGGVSASSVVNEEEDKKHEAMKQERARRGEEIRAKLQLMGAVDLLGMIFRAQQERVATYKVFEEGMSTILASGNMTNYPTLCAKVTASFSVLSDTINAVKSSLDQQHKRRDITEFITQLQKSEGEKLNLTAALHLERLRLRNSQLEMMSPSEGSIGYDDRTVKLLKNGIQSLEQNISGVVESINEVLEELRCIAADENE
eukprot:CAMPEP_0201879470 /NCGR_PEP_ID=MMETSP0902-20130614/10334_1 /ASSEMBLY_ACC=CAM_ASM_000551 /TAXON_ID=420261 /ORGANISM="Thalassiosira antarctica, Strain CCMP982" /LENGTH=273 /DNA_ID=CAMNT_0048407293 /DNA_START=24 /DNA_END=845 /DNA_ORIENTATION=-